LPADSRSCLRRAVGRREGVLTQEHVPTAAALAGKRWGWRGLRRGTRAQESAAMGIPAAEGASSPSTTVVREGVGGSLALRGRPWPSPEAWQVLETTPRVYHPSAPATVRGAAQHDISQRAASPCSLVRTAGVGPTARGDGSRTTVTPAMAVRAEDMQGLEQAGLVTSLNHGGVRTEINPMGHI